GWVKVIEAEAHANLQDQASCQQALHAAESLAHGGTLDADAYWTGFNPSRMAGYIGVCYVRLKQPEKALTALQQALVLMSTSSVRRRPRILSDMAHAHVQQGEIEEACRLADEALAMARHTQNVMVLPRLKRFRQAVEPWKDMAAV